MTYLLLPSGAVQDFLELDGTPHRVILQAADVRKEKTGVHAKVTIAIGLWTPDARLKEGGKHNTTVLAEDTFNVGRSEDRIKLTNHALKEPLLLEDPWKGLAPLFKDKLQHRMLNFTRGLWEFLVSEDIGELLAGAEEREPADYLLEPYILRKAGTIAFAPPGAGKSWIGILIAVLVDAGIAWPWPVKQSKVLYVNLERSADSFARRLADVNEALGLPRTRPIHVINRRGDTLFAITDRLQRYIAKHKIELVIVDSLSRAGAGNMNDNEPANKAMDLMNGLGCAWLLLGHVAREDSGHLFGSQMFDAAADIMVKVTSQRSQIKSTLGVHATLGVGLSGTKANDVEMPPLTIQRFEFDKVRGLVAIQKADSGEFLDIENAVRGDDPTDAMRKYLLGVGAADIERISRDIGVPKRKVASYLARRAEFRIVRTDSEGKAFYGVQDLRSSDDDPPPPDYMPEPVDPQQGFEDMDGLEEALA